MVKIKTRLFTDWDTKIKLRLCNLTLMHGVMWGKVTSEPETRTWVAFEGEKPVAWLVFIPTDKEFEVMLYIRRSHRRRGIGRRLYKTAMRWWKKNGKNKKTSIYPDPENRGFFRKIGRKDAGIDWWDQKNVFC